MRARRPDPGWEHTTVTVGAHRLHVRASIEHGDGLPVVHLHGFGISGTYLMPTARLLTSRGLNVVPDLPGYGRSARPPRPLGIPRLADTALQLLDVYGIDRAVLVGNSMGCPVGIELADRHPDRVDRLVLVSPAGGAHNQPFRRAISQLALDGLRERPRMARTAVPDYLRFGPINSLHLFKSMTAYPALDRLHELQVPTLVVVGDRDPLVPGRERVATVAAELPEWTTVVLIEGAAHALNFSHPGELAHVITSWLDGVEIADDPTQPGHSSILPVTRL